MNLSTGSVIMVIGFVLWLARSKEFDGPLDGLIYGAMVGTGFAFTENLLYAFTAFGEDGLFSGIFVAGFRSAFQIIGHPLYTGLTGYGIGAYKVKIRGNRLNRLPHAMILHALWNGTSFFGVLWVIPFLLIVIVSIIVLRRELKKALDLDKRAFESGYYDKGSNISYLPES